MIFACLTQDMALQSHWYLSRIFIVAGISPLIDFEIIIITRQVTRATHVRNRICPRVKLIIKIIIILQIIFLGFIKSKSC